MTHEIRVREAVPADWPAVESLLAELGRPDVRGSEDEAEHAARFESYISRPDAIALLAELDGEIVGFVDVEFRQRLNFAKPQAWIPDLIVLEQARGRRVGAALLARAEEVSRDRGCWGITLESATWRSDAHRFYEREEWRNTAHSFSKPLTYTPWPLPPPEPNR